MNESLRALAHARRVLVLHDLHPDADNAAWRGALLANRQGGWLRILHVSRMRSPEAARERLAPLVWRLQEHMQLAVLPQAFRGSWTGELRRAAEDADLVVLRAPSGLDAVTGLHPMRAAQLANRPTLVVRTPATAGYRRILVGIEQATDTHAVQSALSTMSDGRELPAVAPLHSAAALLARERSLFPDLVALPCTASPSLARRFLALTGADTLLLPSESHVATPQPTQERSGTLLGHGVLVSHTDLPIGERP